jgi:predicted DNA-binding transcriptional regulator AlpA
LKPQNDFEKLAVSVAEKLKQSIEEVMDIDMLCDFIHLDKPTIYALTSQRRIPFTKPTGKLLFLKSKIIAWLEENNMPTQEEIKSNIHYKGRNKK